MFFDLDHTLWDFDRNSGEALSELYEVHGFQSRGVGPFSVFYHTFLRVNGELWNRFDRGLVPHSYIRENRFRLVFDSLGVEDCSDSLKLGESYLSILPYKPHLIEGAMEVLDYVRLKGYRLHIITNGFEHVQFAKMDASRIRGYFDHIVASDRINARKPEARIFEHAMSLAKTDSSSGMMIGDNLEADIAGGNAVGMDTVYFGENAGGKSEATYMITSLKELMNIL